jgi:methylmalonyl-CoA mutase cobalamin-binding domain/chain
LQQDGRSIKSSTTGYADVGFDVDTSTFQTQQPAAKQAVENDVHLCRLLAAGHKLWSQQVIEELKVR